MINTIVNHPLFYVVIVLLVIAYFVSMFVPERKKKRVVDIVYTVQETKTGVKVGQWQNRS